MPWPIHGHIAAGAAVVAVLCAPAPAAHAQASPYLSLDDPRLPLLEHLISRGDIADPSPMVRPFRAIDAARALAAADTAGNPSSGLIASLRAQLERPSDEAAWQAGGRVGAQAFSHIRRDVLHPLGRDGARPYAEVRAGATAGSIVLASRLAAEPRLPDDPEWPGRRDLELAWRMIDSYLGAQFRHATLFYGQIDRNWGPTGLPGIGLSNYGYPQVEAGLGIHAGGFNLTALARALHDERTADGAVVHRYFFAHRLSARLSNRVHVGLWETTVLGGVDREFDGRYRNPLSLLLFSNQYGLAADGNVMIGADGHWRIGRRTTLQAQLAIDDLQYQNTTGPDRYPNRWAFTVAAFGALGRSASWRALYTQASSLAFRTLNPFENFTERGVGIGRNFADQDQVTLFVSVPATAGWLLTPEATVLRQGEGRINDPFPASSTEAGQLPNLFIGTVERTWRVALGITGRQGPLDLTANAGFHHVVNAGHDEGRTVNRFEGRLQATVGITTGGALR